MINLHVSRGVGHQELQHLASATGTSADLKVTHLTTSATRQDGTTGTTWLAIRFLFTEDMLSEDPILT